MVAPLREKTVLRASLWHDPRLGLFKSGCKLISGSFAAFLDRRWRCTCGSCETASLPRFSPRPGAVAGVHPCRRGCCRLGRRCSRSFGVRPMVSHLWATSTTTSHSPAFNGQFLFNGGVLWYTYMITYQTIWSIVSYNLIFITKSDTSITHIYILN